MTHITTVTIPTETSGIAVIDVTVTERDTHVIEISGELVDQSPEAITAAIQLAMLEIRRWRRPA